MFGLEIMKQWMIYLEVIRDTVRVRPKHEERSCGDCRVSKHDFCALEKLMHQPLERDAVHEPRELAVGVLQVVLEPG